MHTVQKRRLTNRPMPDPHRADWEKRTKCPECGQFHLRAGYCQALDPESPWHESRLGKLHKAKQPVKQDIMETFDKLAAEVREKS